MNALYSMLAYYRHMAEARTCLAYAVRITDRALAKQSIELARHFWCMWERTQDQIIDTEGRKAA